MVSVKRPVANIFCWCFTTSDFHVLEVQYKYEADGKLFHCIRTTINVSSEKARSLIWMVRNNFHSKVFENGLVGLLIEVTLKMVWLGFWVRGYVADCEAVVELWVSGQPAALHCCGKVGADKSQIFFTHNNAIIQQYWECCNICCLTFTSWVAFAPGFGRSRHYRLCYIHA